MFSIGKQPYKDVINFVSYIHVVYSYNDINFTYLYMRTNYLCHLANIVHILWSRPVGDSLFLPPPPLRAPMLALAWLYNDYFMYKKVNINKKN